MKKKTRMSGVIDNSSMGLSVGNGLGTEMEISRTSYTKLRKCFASAAKHGVTKYNVKFVLVGGHKTEGNATYHLYFVDKTKTVNCIQYEFKKMGGNHFINVSGNPTVMIAGGNDIPILVVGFEYGKYNAPTITLKWLNRIMYAALDELLAEFGFKWTGLDKKNLVEGNFDSQRYQIAWYSGDLRDKRTALMLYIRSIYCGMDLTSDRAVNVVADIGLNGRAWPNSEGNLTIEAKSGAVNKYFSLTLYAKDLDPKYSTLETDRVANLIRWDCTLFNSFLRNSKIKKIKDLEARYIETCEKDGYDIGFIYFVSRKIQEQLKIEYLIELNVQDYKQMLKELNGVRGKNEIILAEHWLSYGETFDTAAELARHLNMKESTLSDAKKSIAKQTKLDIEIPRTTQEAILDNRERGTLTKEERGELLLDINGKSNKAVKRSVTIERDKKNSETYSKLLKNTDTQGVLRVRRFKPVKIKPANFWIYTCPPLPENV